MVNRVEGNEMESHAAVGRGARRPRQSPQAPALAAHRLSVLGQAMPTCLPHKMAPAHGCDERAWPQLPAA